MLRSYIIKKEMTRMYCEEWMCGTMNTSIRLQSPGARHRRLLVSRRQSLPHHHTQTSSSLSYTATINGCVPQEQEQQQQGRRSVVLALVSSVAILGGTCPVAMGDEETMPLVFDEESVNQEISQMRTITNGSAIDGQGALRVILSDQLETAEEDELSVTQRQALQINRRTQRQNNVPPDFPLFVREGYDMTVLASGGYQVTDDGLIYKDYVVGSGKEPRDGQQVTFDYTAYNESAAVIDSSYRKGQAASTRLGISGMIPGFEMGIKTMKPGGKRRIVVPPELGPPVGPSTFFSAKQFEVFDVELRSSKSCTRRTIGMFSDVVCTDDDAEQ